MKPLVTVIIPVHNRAWCLGRALESVCDQKSPPDECIVVDDGSTDGTAAVVQEFTANAPFAVRLLRQENRGAAAARNLGIRAARGELLAFLDSDDWYHPDKLALQSDVHQNHPGLLISHTREVWYRYGRRVNQKKKHRPGHGHIFERCLAMCVVGMSTVMARRELFSRYGLFDETLPCCEDYDLWLRVAREQPFHLLDRALTYKEGGHEDQLSRRYRLGMDRFRIRALCNLLLFQPLSRQQQQMTQAELSRKCTIYGQGCIKHGRLEEGRWYLDLIEHPERIFERFPHPRTGMARHSVPLDDTEPEDRAASTPASKQ